MILDKTWTFPLQCTCINVGVSFGEHITDSIFLIYNKSPRISCFTGLHKHTFHSNLFAHIIEYRVGACIFADLFFGRFTPMYLSRFILFRFGET